MVQYFPLGLHIYLLVFHLAIFVYRPTKVFIMSFKLILIVTSVVVCYSTMIWYFVVGKISSDVSLTTIRIIVSCSTLTLIIDLEIVPISFIFFTVTTSVVINNFLLVVHILYHIYLFSVYSLLYLVL